MSLEGDLRWLLINDVAVTALVAERVYPLFLPQTPTLPAITYQRISTVRNYSQRGSSHLAQVRVQVNCWGSLHTEVIALAQAVRNALQGHMLIGNGFVDNEIDTYEPDTGRHRRIVDVLIWHSEA